MGFGPLFLRPRSAAAFSSFILKIGLFFYAPCALGFKHKQSFSQNKEHTTRVCSLFWRRRWDLNPCAGYPTYSLSRGAPSPLGYFCMVKLNLTIYNQVVKPVINVWRREWDSNPRCLATRRFSRPFRYDHFGISPYSAKVILSHQSTYVKHK